jgi:hypothetical protein
MFLNNQGKHRFMLLYAVLLDIIRLTIWLLSSNGMMIHNVSRQTSVAMEYSAETN